MIKKLIIMGILTIPFLLLTKMATAQNYEDMTPVIQEKMAENKNAGKDLLSDIYVQYELTFGGIKDQASGAKLKNILIEKMEATNIVYDKTNKHVSFSCPAKYNLKNLNSFIKQEGFEMNNLFKEEYTLNKN